MLCITINVEQKLYISTTSFNFKGPVYEGASLRGCIVGTNRSIHYNESLIQKIAYDRSSQSAANSSNKYKSSYLLKKKSDERLSTLLEPLNQSRGTSPDPNFRRRWQVWTIWSMQMMVAFGRCCHVDRDSLYIPSWWSHEWNCLNQCMYASSWENLPNCVGSMKINWISVTQRPIKRANLLLIYDNGLHHIPSISPSLHPL